MGVASVFNGAVSDCGRTVTTRDKLPATIVQIGVRLAGPPKRVVR